MQLPQQADWPIFKEIFAERDRGAALIAAGFLDRKLTDALETCLRDDKEATNRMFKPSGPLGGTFNKALLGYTLGLFRKETLKDIEVIGEIRNRFAHHPDPIDFASTYIRERVARLGLFDRVWGLIPAPEARPPKPEKPRDLYLETISLAANWLHHQATHPGIFRNRDDLPF